MLSRSSSAYQKLDVSPNDVVNGGGITNAAGAHEMTSIAVISAHPTTSATTHQILPQNGNGGGGSGSAVSKRAAVMTDDFANVMRSKHKSERTPWTSFHSLLFIGIAGFFIFWIFILSKMYLPSEYLWGLINGDDKDSDAEGNGSLPPLMPPYSKASNVSDED